MIYYIKGGWQMMTLPDRHLAPAERIKGMKEQSVDTDKKTGTELIL